MVSRLPIFDIMPVAKSRVYGKQALRNEGRVHEKAFVTYAETCVNTEYISYEPADLSSRKTDEVLLYLRSYSLAILTIHSNVNITKSRGSYAYLLKIMVLFLRYADDLPWRGIFVQTIVDQLRNCSSLFRRQSLKCFFTHVKIFWLYFLLTFLQRVI